MKSFYQGESLLHLEFDCKEGRVTKRIQVERFLAELIKFKLKNMSENDFFFCNDSKQRLALPNKFSKSLNPYFEPSMCRQYRATIELQNTFESVIKSSEKSPAVKQLIVSKLMLNLNENGCYLANDHFMQMAFQIISKLLTHNMQKNYTIYISDLFYIDDRLVFHFFKYFLNDEHSKLFYYKFFRMSIDKSESFEAWSSKHHWAFDAPDVYPKQMFEPYFDNNNWIDKLN